MANDIFNGKQKCLIETRYFLPTEVCVINLFSTEKQSQGSELIAKPVRIMTGPSWADHANTFYFS